MIATRRKQQNYYSLDEFTLLIDKLVKTFSFLESLKIAHRDIKPENLMYDENGNIKIVDLGESLLGEDDRESISIDVQGSLLYLAPELRKMYESDDFQSEHKTNVYKCDVYSLGLVFLQVGCLATGSEIAGINAMRLQNLKFLLNEIKERYGTPYEIFLSHIHLKNTE